MTAEETLTVDIVKSTSEYTDKKHKIAQQELSAGQVHPLPVNARTFENPEERDDEARPAKPRHAFP